MASCQPVDGTLTPGFTPDPPLLRNDWPQFHNLLCFVSHCDSLTGTRILNIFTHRLRQQRVPAPGAPITLTDVLPCSSGIPVGAHGQSSSKNVYA